MEKFQVTAKFGNIYEIVGSDTVDEAEAYRLFNLYQNACRSPRMYKIVGNGSRLVKGN
jgi:hypothetical protein